MTKKADNKKAAEGTIKATTEAEAKAAKEAEEAATTEAEAKAAKEAEEAAKAEAEAKAKEAGLFSVEEHASKHRVPSWQSAALYRLMGWEAGMMVTETAYRDGLAQLTNRRMGG